MNGPWEPYAPGVNGNAPADYVSMWRHVHDLATQAGAGNITWVWCPNVDPNNKYTSYAQLYPGNAYVDWTCFDGYNKTGNESFSDIFSASYQKLLDLAPTKPIMIGETSSVEGGAGKAAWVTDALTQLPTSFPQIKAVVWFNWRIFEANRWWEWPIESSPSTQQAFRAGISSPYYVPGGTFGSLPLGSKIGPP
jgi:beta-mannanase